MLISEKSQSSIVIQEAVAGRPPAVEEVTLKRDLGVLGSFSIGFADVGADIYVALGLVLFFAMGVAPLALAVAALGYLFTALSYAELASSIPLAGGASVFAREAFDDFWSFVAGWGLLLDYTIDIALFGWITLGYLGSLCMNLASIGVPYIGALSVVNSMTTVSAGGLPDYTWQAIATIVICILLLALNYVGIRESANFNIILSILSIISEGALFLIGFFVAWNWQTFAHNITQLGTGVSWQNFGWGITVAMVSFIGLESISQSAEETKRPDKVIPRSTFALIVSVIVAGMLLSILAVGLPSMSPAIIGTTYQNDPVAGVARGIGMSLSQANPLVIILPLWAGAMGFLMLFMSTNTGVIGASRVTYSMSRNGIMPKWFSKLHPKFRVPTRTIVVFTLASVFFVLFVWLMGTYHISSEDPTIILGDLYNYGALVSFMLVNLALIKLRNSRPGLYRPFKSPFSFNVHVKGKDYVVPLLPLLGFFVCFFVWVLVLNLHQIGKIVGTLWFIAGISMYLIYRHKKKLHWSHPKTGTLVTHPDIAHSLHPEIADELKSKYEGIKAKAIDRHATPVVYHDILVPISRPETMESMVEIACDLLAEGGRIRLVNVVEVPPQLPAGGTDRDARSSWMLKKAAEYARAKGVEADADVVYARFVTEAIINAAGKWGADLIVLGSSQRTTTEKFFFGNVVDVVLRGSPCDVVVLSYAGEMSPLSYEKILVPTSGYKHAWRALEIGMSLEKNFGGIVTSIYVGQSAEPSAGDEILDKGRQYAEAYGVRHDAIYRQGNPVNCIVDTARDGGYTLIIIGSTERPHYYKTLVGSTADEVIKQAPCNVLVVKMKT